MQLTVMFYPVLYRDPVLSGALPGVVPGVVLGVVPGAISVAVTDASARLRVWHQIARWLGMVLYLMLVSVDTLMVSALGCGERIEGVILFICRLQSV